MSVYPGNYDSFSTHVDNTEFMTAADLNNVQAAIVAIQNTLGINPQGSYATTVAWLNALNAAIAGGLSLDTSAGDIQAVGTAAAAGSKGKAADAGHVHVGVTSISLNGAGAATGAFSFSAVTSLSVNGGGASSGAVNINLVASLNVNGAGAQTGAVAITIPQIDTTASDIQPLASAPIAGATGKSADAGHAHTEGMGGVLTWMSI